VQNKKGAKQFEIPKIQVKKGKKCWIFMVNKEKTKKKLYRGMKNES